MFPWASLLTAMCNLVSKKSFLKETPHEQTQTTPQPLDCVTEQPDLLDWYDSIGATVAVSESLFIGKSLQ